MKQFSCGDVVPGCTRVFQETDEASILQAVAAHARDDHGLTDIPSGMVDQVRRLIVSA